MDKVNLFTVTGNYWHYHLIGTGTIFTYHKKAKQVLVTCEATGGLIETIDLYKQGGFCLPEQFKKATKRIYQEMIEVTKVTLDLDYINEERLEIVGCVGVDFKLLEN